MWGYRRIFQYRPGHHPYYCRPVTDTRYFSCHSGLFYSGCNNSSGRIPVIHPRDNIRENVTDLRDTSAGISEEIRNAFQKPEGKPGEPAGTTQGTPVAPPPPAGTDSNRALWLVGLIIILIGLFFLMINLFGWIWSRLWPISLIAVGLIIILLVFKRK